MSAHQHAHDRIEHVGVEQTAQELLRLEGDDRAQAEDRVGGERAGGNDGGNQRLTVADARDVAVTETRPIERGAGEESPRAGAIDVMRRCGQVGLKRLDVLALEHRETLRAEVIAVVKVDNRVIGNGEPGQMTRDLERRFKEYARA